MIFFHKIMVTKKKFFLQIYNVIWKVLTPLSRRPAPPPYCHLHFLIVQISPSEGGNENLLPPPPLTAYKKLKKMLQVIKKESL